MLTPEWAEILRWLEDRGFRVVSLDRDHGRVTVEIPGGGDR